MLHFVRTFSIMHALGVKLIVIEKVQNYGKIVLIENMFENDWWGGSPTSPPVRTDKSLTTTPTSRFGCSMTRTNSVTAVLK